MNKKCTKFHLYERNVYEGRTNNEQNMKNTEKIRKNVYKL